MGVHELPWMKAPISSTQDELNSYGGNKDDTTPLHLEESSSEYGMHQQQHSPPKSPGKRHRDYIGQFLDYNDGNGPRLLFNDREIDWIKKNFTLMQLARDDFVVKYSILSNLSPERLQ